MSALGSSEFDERFVGFHTGHSFLRCAAAMFSPVTRTPKAALALSLTALLAFTGITATAAPAMSLPGAPVSAVPGASEDTVDLQLSGTLIVSVVEAPPTDDMTAGLDHSDRVYTVRTETGKSVAVTGPDLESARTGDAFDGVVGIPSGLLNQIGGRTEERLREQRAGSALSIETADGSIVVNAAEAAGEPLPIVEAAVVAATAAVAEPARDHAIDLVVLNPAGVAPLGGSYSDWQLGQIAGEAAEFWLFEAARGPEANRIPWFTSSPQVVRHATVRGCDQSLDSLWDTAAQQLGFIDALDYLESSAGDGPVRHLVTYLPPGCLDVEPIAVGTVGANANSGGLVMVTLGTEFDISYTTHELGHNFGLGHSNIDFCTKDAVVLGCTEYEYGDLYDVMGATVPGWVTALNSASALALGWTDPSATAQLALADGELQRTWSINLTQLGAPGGAGYPRIVEVTDPASGDIYTVEHRHEFGDLAYYDRGYAFYMDEAGEDAVFYDNGVRLLRRTVDGGTSAYTVPSAKADYNQASAWYGKDAQDAVIANPSGSVVVEVVGGDSGGIANVTITLSRSDVSQAQPVYRFWSDRFQGHFYTISAAERDKVSATWPDVWSYEGPRYSAFSSQVPGTVPLFRFWSERFRSHFYTTDPVERDRVNRLWPDVWADEGVAYYVYPMETDEPNTVRMARFWSPLKSHHFYTADPIERDRVIRTWPSPIWDYEGDMFRVPLTK